MFNSMCPRLVRGISGGPGDMFIAPIKAATFPFNPLWNVNLRDPIWEDFTTPPILRIFSASQPLYEMDGS